MFVPIHICFCFNRNLLKQKISFLCFTFHFTSIKSNITLLVCEKQKFLSFFLYFFEIKITFFYPPSSVMLFVCHLNLDKRSNFSFILIAYHKSFTFSCFFFLFYFFVTGLLCWNISKYLSLANRNKMTTSKAFKADKRLLR